MEAAHTFHKLWIIEALPDGDLKTGTFLYENGLEQARKDHPNLKVTLKTPKTKKEVLSILDEILDEAKGGSYPMIHFECHGCDAGLGSTGEELVSWDEIRKHLIDINRACRMNLVVVVAACNGAHLIKVASQLDRAPFLFVIGSEDELYEEDIERDFGAFYKKVFEGLDGDAHDAAAPPSPDRGRCGVSPQMEA